MNRLSFTLCALLGGGCNSTGVGNPPVVDLGTQALGITVDEEDAPDAQEIDSDPVVKGGLFGRTALTHAALLFSEMRYVACDGTLHAEPGPFVVDLVQNTVSPSLPLVDWPESGLCSIQAVFGVAAQPPYLAGYSAVLIGEREAKGPFIARIALEGTLTLLPREGRSWEPSKHAWLWALRPKKWLADEDLDESDTSVDCPPAPTSEADAGVAPVRPRLRELTVSKLRHPLIYEAIRKRLGQRSSLHVDENDNGELDEAERSGKRAYIGRGEEITE